MTDAEVKTRSSRLTRLLSQPGSVRETGGKSHHLARMLQAGLPVPPGFVVTNAAFQEFLNKDHRRERIATIVDQIDVTNPQGLQQGSDEIRELVTTSSLPAELADEVWRLREEHFSDRTVVVRSSAVGEDSEFASFAGQLDSILNVNTKDELVSAMLMCWASYWSARSLFYQCGRGVPLDGMGILIQEQACSAVSGVLFTVSPDGMPQNSQQCMAVEFCRGFGSALVSGEINPGRFLISRDDHLRTGFESSGDSAADAAMSDTVVERLAEFGLQLEELFDGPQDVEWTVDESGRLFLLQSRGITALAQPLETRMAPVSNSSGHSKTNCPDGAAAPCSGSNTGAPTRKTLWSNANVNENFPDAICPLLYSVASTGYYHYFRNLGIAIGISTERLQSMDGALRHIIGVHGARMYYNLTNIHACLRMAPRGEPLTELFNNFVGADRIAEHDTSWPSPDAGRSRLGQFLEVTTITAKVGWRILRLEQGVREFEGIVDRFAAESRPEDLQNQHLPKLLSLFLRFIDIRSHRWVKASLADAAAMLSYGLLKTSLNAEFPDEDLASLHNTLLKGLPDLASNRPVIGLWHLSRQIQDDPRLTALFQQETSEVVWNAIRTRLEFSEFLASFHSYLDDCGFRCSGELMLTVASFQENPVALIDILKAYSALQGESPTERLQEQESERIAETKRVLKMLSRRCQFRFLPWPRRSLKVRWLLKWTQHSIALRERARLKQALLYSRLRMIVLQIGARLTDQCVLREQNDIFFLTHSEIDELLSGGSMFPHDTAAMVTQRKAAHEHVQRLVPPDTFELPEGESWRAPDKPLETAQATPDSELGTHLAGVGACGGRITASAAVLQDVAEFSRLSQGDILVTRQTDPGWGPLFFLIRGLVIERGGMLSHGAILAREYGIPTVVGVPGATEKIAHGQTVTVDGNRGTVGLSHE